MPSSQHVVKTDLNAVSSLNSGAIERKYFVARLLDSRYLCAVCGERAHGGSVQRQDAGAGGLPAPDRVPRHGRARQRGLHPRQRLRQEQGQEGEEGLVASLDQLQLR